MPLFFGFFVGLADTLKFYTVFVLYIAGSCSKTVAITGLKIGTLFFDTCRSNFFRISLQSILFVGSHSF